MTGAGSGREWGDSSLGDQHVGDLLSGLLDGELAPSVEESVQAHAAACPACAAEYEDVRSARAWVRGLPAVVPPATFFEHVLDEPRLISVGGPDSRRRGRHPWVAVGALAASAAAAVALVGFAAPREPPVTPSVTRLVETHATGASLDGDPLSHLAPIGVRVSFRR